MINTIKKIYSKWYNVFITFGSSGILSALGIITGIITARALLPTGKGELTAIMLWPQIFYEIFGIGLYYSAVYYSGKYINHLGYVTGTLIVAGFLQGILISIIGLFMIPHILTQYNEKVIFFLNVVFFISPLIMIGNYSLPILQGIGQFKKWNAIKLIQSFLYTIGVVLIWLFKYISLRNVLIIYYFSILLNAFIGWYLVKKFIHKNKFSKRLLYRMLNYGYKNMLSSVATQANLRLDQAIISIQLAPAFLGIYKVAVSIANFIAIISTAFASVLFSDASRTENKQEAYKKIMSSYKAAIAPLLLATILLILIIPYVIPIIYSKAYHRAIMPAQILCFGVFIFGLSHILFNGAKGQGKPIVQFVSQIIALIVTIIGLLLLLKRFQILGAAITSLLAYTTGFVIVTSYFYRFRKKNKFYHTT